MSVDVSGCQWISVVPVSLQHFLLTLLQDLERHSVFQLQGQRSLSRLSGPWHSAIVGVVEVLWI